jgi:hypothetical protein
VKHAYLYYRIDPVKANLAASRVGLLLNMLAGHCSQAPRHLSRCDDPHMWMEIYEGIADFPAFTSALNSAVETFDCAEFTLGERYLECFTAPPGVPDDQAQ